jgi:hypothetical protein
MILRWLLYAVAAACMGMSASLAYLFGAARADSAIMSIVFGLVCLSSDGTRARAAWVAFFILTGMSLWAAFGNLAGEAATKHATKIVEARKLGHADGTLERLRADRKRLGEFEFTTEGAAELAKQHATNEAKRALDECATGRGRKCDRAEIDSQKATAAAVKAEENRGKTKRANELDDQIAKAEAAVGATTTTTAIRETDPQAKVLAEATGLGIELFGMVNHIFLASVVEIVSGLGLWLIHGWFGRKRPADAAEVSANAPAAETPLAAPAAPQTPQEIRALFFANCVFTRKDSRVYAKDVYAGYCIWCRRHGFKPMTAQAFGMGDPWKHKDRDNRGRVYLHCAIAADLVAELAADAAANDAREPVRQKASVPTLRLVAANTLQA